MVIYLSIGYGRCPSRVVHMAGGALPRPRISAAQKRSLPHSCSHVTAASSTIAARRSVVRPLVDATLPCWNADADRIPGTGAVLREQEAPRPSGDACGARGTPRGDSPGARTRKPERSAGPVVSTGDYRLRPAEAERVHLLSSMQGPVSGTGRWQVVLTVDARCYRNIPSLQELNIRERRTGSR
jgi:hypothetical protein